MAVVCVVEIAFLSFEYWYAIKKKRFFCYFLTTKRVYIWPPTVMFRKMETDKTFFLCYGSGCFGHMSDNLCLLRTRRLPCAASINRGTSYPTHDVITGIRSYENSGRDRESLNVVRPAKIVLRGRLLGRHEFILRRYPKIQLAPVF